jgi:acyl carrier protein
MTHGEPTLETLRAHLAAAIPNLPDDPAEDLFTAGVMDSLKLVEVAMLVEKAFSISLEPEDFKAENFSTLERMAATVEAVCRRNAP